MIALAMGISFQKRRKIGKDYAKGGSEGGRRTLISQFHVRTFMAIPGRCSARLSHDLTLFPGHRLFVFEKRCPWPKLVILFMKLCQNAPVFWTGELHKPKMIP